MTDWQEGDRVDVTLRLTVDGAGQFRGFTTRGDLLHLLSPDSRHIVRVERAPVELPTGFGARIRATVTCECSMRAREEAAVLILARPDAVNDKWLAAKGLACGHRRFAEHEIADVVVLDGGEA